MMVEQLLFGVDIAELTHNVFYAVLIMIVFDVLTGILASARERKINSSISFNGLIRKAGLVVSLAFISFVDLYFQTDGVITNTAVGLLIAYEGMSIIENLSIIGIDFNFLTKYFEPEKVGKEDKNE